MPATWPQGWISASDHLLSVLQPISRAEVISVPMWQRDRWTGDVQCYGASEPRRCLRSPEGYERPSRTRRVRELGADPAVDHECLPCHVGRQVRGEEEDRARDVARSPDSAEGCVLGRACLALFTEERCDARGPPGARCDRVGANAAGSELHGDGSDERHETRLGRAVSRVAWRAREPAHGGDEHHDAAAIHHGAAGELCREVRVAEDHVEVPVPVLVAALEDGAVARLADDVDDAVEPPERATGVGDQSLDGAARPDVAGPWSAADLGSDGAGTGTVDVGADHARPSRRERVRGLTTDAPTRSDDGEAAAVETEQRRIVGHRAPIEGVAHTR